MGTFPVNRLCDPARLPGTLVLWHSHKMRKVSGKQRHFIKEWRKHRNLTQDQLAERIGVDRTYVSKIEAGKKRYDQPFLEAAAEALNCDPASLIMRNPLDPEAIWSIWEQIPPEDRPHAMRALAAFAKRPPPSGPGITPKQPATARRR